MKECCRFKLGTCVAESNPQPEENFSKDRKRKDQLTVHCKSCLREIRKSGAERQYAYTKEWRKRNPEKCREYTRTKDALANAKIRKKRYILKCRYGLTTDQWEKMHKDQNWTCPICLLHMNECVEKELHVDHCHKTGKVRGLLCSNCNKALGLLKDNFEMLDRAISYLKGSQ